jgi:hypothetical protein
MFLLFLMQTIRAEKAAAKNAQNGVPPLLCCWAWISVSLFPGFQGNKDLLLGRKHRGICANFFEKLKSWYEKRATS